MAFPSKSLLSWAERASAHFLLIARRLRHHLGLTISSALGILTILTLVVAAPVFTRAVLSQVLQQQLNEKALKNQRSLFSLHVYTLDQKAYTPLTLDGAEEVTRWIEQAFTNSMGLQVEQTAFQVNSKQLLWKPLRYASAKPYLKELFVGFASSSLLPEQVRLVEGEWPQADPGQGPLPVAVHETFADANFVNVGDRFKTGDLEVEVVGIFRALDEGDPLWFYDPDTTFRDRLCVPLEFFRGRLGDFLERPLFQVSWYTIAKDESLRFSQSQDYARQMRRLEADLAKMLPTSKVDYSPLDMLTAYQERMQWMTTLFYAVGAPILALVLIFTSLAARIALQQFEQESATMRSRGMSFWQGAWQNISESLVLVLAALLPALFLGWVSALVMGSSRLFLQFERRVLFHFSLRDVHWGWLAAAGLVVVVTRLLPYLGLKRASVVTMKQERSRSLKKPAWERFFIDVILLAASLYLYLAQRGMAQPLKLLSGLPHGGSGGSQVDPLTFAASSIFILGASLFSLRLFNLVMRLFSRLTNRIPQVWSYLAFQEMVRQPRNHFDAMLLIMISLSLAIFSASMAKTLDRWMQDAAFYQAGADLAIREYQAPGGAGAAPGVLAVDEAGQGVASQAVESLISLERHLQLEGIRQATYVGKYPGSCAYGAEKIECEVMGIDRLSFPKAAFYRKDFSAASLGTLMNLLAGEPLGILVPQSFLDATGLVVGDRLRLSTSAGTINLGFNQEMQILAAYRYFPSVYPAETPVVIANLETLFGGPDAVMGYEVWLDLDYPAGDETVLRELRQMAQRETVVINVQGNALEAIRQAMSGAEWVGLFGMINIGFILTGLMPGIGFVLYSYASLRKRFVQLGILQAIGLSVRQLVGALVLEQALLMGVALGAGAGIGLLTSRLFLPVLQISVTRGTPAPPFQVLVGWQESAWLGLVFGMVLLVTIAASIFYLARIKVFQAVKLGETL